MNMKGSKKSTAAVWGGEGDLNVKGAANYARFAELLSARSESPKVLVIGGSILGEGMQALVNQPSIELIETDVSFGPRTQLILDAHDIPFEDETFDGVVVQAVLEHVADPYRCVDEIRRVLKMGGAIYAETAFLQPVHGGRYDFTRFTLLGPKSIEEFTKEQNEIVTLRRSFAVVTQQLEEVLRNLQAKK